MSELKSDSAIKLTYSNWHPWDHYIKSTIHQKNAYIAFDPEPVNPHTSNKLYWQQLWMPQPPLASQSSLYPQLKS